MARVTLHEYCSEARECIATHAYEEAIAICRHILQRYPKHIETYRILGEACLEKGELGEAMDTFKRLLSADPENLVAYAGLGVIYEEKQQLAAAIWHMERAFELASTDETRGTLRRLYSQRDGTEVRRIKLNKVALARLYSKGGQYRQAIEEFRRCLELEPTRIDIRVSLLETLWRDGRREQAAEMAQEILQTLPDCLKAILLLGTIWIDKGRNEDGWAILARARALDPENRVAQALLGERSPLPPQVIKIPRYKPEVTPPGEEKPEPLAISEEEVIPAAETATEAASAELPAPALTPVEEQPEAIIEPVSEAVSAPEAVTEVAPDEVSVPAAPPLLERQPEAVATPEEIVVAPEAMAVPKAESASAPAGVSEAVPVAVPATATSEKGTLPEEAMPLPVETMIAGPLLSLVERYKLQLQQNPKDDETRLNLARVYRDQEQITQALEHYSAMLRAKPEILSEVIVDMEGIVASRPDNLAAHELLADLYAKNGKLQKALERYRWLLQQLEQKPS